MGLQSEPSALRGPSASSSAHPRPEQWAVCLLHGHAFVMRPELPSWPWAPQQRFQKPSIIIQKKAFVIIFKVIHTHLPVGLFSLLRAHSHDRGQPGGSAAACAV